VTGVPAESARALRRPQRARRTDPHRKERILDAAIAVLAERGVAGATHRLIAAAADVPLGSLTYHFESLEDLRGQAFTRLSQRVTVSYEAHFTEVGSPDDLVEAVTNLVHGAVGADTAEWAVTYELYLAALRDPALRVVTEGWMRASRTVLERFVDPDTARSLDALIEGMVMHRMLSTAPATRDQTRTAVRRMLAGTEFSASAEQPRDPVRRPD
jgi:TetR/AcrR family transcriptional regulator, regulator of biofilm formation and stress response